MRLGLERVDRSARAISALSASDPEFVELCKSLYGPGVEPVTVWNDVFGKANPVGADLSTTDNGSQTRRRLGAGFGIATTGAGAALGVKEVAQGAAKWKREGALGAEKTGGKLLRLAKSPAGKVGWGGAVLLGDAEAISSLRERAKQPVDKADIPGVSRISRGIESQMRRAMPVVNDVKAGFKGAAPHSKAYEAQAAQNYLAGGQVASGAPKYSGAARVGGVAQTVTQLAAGTPKRAAATATGGGLLVAQHKMHQRGGAGKSNDGASGPPAPGQMPYPEPYAARYGKRDDSIDVHWQGEFSKLDDDQHLAFGWASVVEMNGVPVKDRQGDFITPEDMEKAAYKYVLESRIGGDMHKRAGSAVKALSGGILMDDRPHHVSTLVESMVFTPEKVAKMGLPAGSVPSSWWVGFKVHDEDVWQLVKKGERLGFSIHGRGKRVPVNEDELIPGYH